MKYRCLRDCFVESRLWRKGGVYELPPRMDKDPKNFAPVAESAAEAPKSKPDEIPEGLYWCGKCQSLHKETSNIGKRHLKHKE